MQFADLVVGLGQVQKTQIVPFLPARPDLIALFISLSMVELIFNQQPCNLQNAALAFVAKMSRSKCQSSSKEVIHAALKPFEYL